MKQGGPRAIRGAASSLDKHTLSVLVLWENICLSGAGLFKSLSIFICKLPAGDRPV